MCHITAREGPALKVPMAPILRAASPRQFLIPTPGHGQDFPAHSLQQMPSPQGCSPSTEPGCGTKAHSNKNKHRLLGRRIQLIQLFFTVAVKKSWSVPWPSRVSQAAGSCLPCPPQFPLASPSLISAFSILQIPTALCLSFPTSLHPLCSHRY